MNIVYPPILSANKNLLISELLHLVLKRHGFHVEHVATGMEIIKKIRQQPYSAVFVNPDMHDISGLDLLRIIKNDETLKHINVIILTDSDCDVSSEKAFMLGASAVLTKPVSGREILNAIAPICKTKKKNT